jgi:hypothetical protein
MNKELRHKINLIISHDWSSENKISQIANEIFKFKNNCFAYQNEGLYKQYEQTVRQFFYNAYLNSLHSDFFTCLEMEFKI